MRRDNPLLYRKDGSLDFGPLLLALTALVGLFIFVLDAFGVTRVTIAAWSYLGAFTGLSFIAGAAAERAFWIAQSQTPGSIAQGIAQSAPLDTDDGRGP